MNKLIFIALMLCASANAESLFSANGDGTHFAEHFVSSGLIFTGTYLAMHDGLGAPKLTSTIFGVAVAEVAGFTYKYMEWMQEGYMPKNMGKSMLFNQIGIFVPAVLVIHFNL